MNVTILVGNGFDLNLNLKTQYTDFIKDLLSVNILRTFRPKITVLKNSVIATKIFVENLHCI